MNGTPPRPQLTARRFIRRLCTPLIYFAALLLMLEQWLWRSMQALLARIPDWPVLNRLQHWLQSLPPYAALLIFLAPTVLLLPVKLLALYAITHDHPALGLAVVIGAKLGGTALVAHLYASTRRSLLSLPWFARWHDAVLNLKDRLIAQLHASAGWRLAQALLRRIRRHWQQLAGRMLMRFRSSPGAAPARLLRLLRRLAARFKW